MLAQPAPVTIRSPGAPRLGLVPAPSAEPMIAPSILSADFAHLGAAADAVVAGRLAARGRDGQPLRAEPDPRACRWSRACCRATDLPLDCHLMIDDPDRWAPGYAEAGAANVTFHVEAAADPVATARAIRQAGALAGLSVKPGTPLEPYLELLTEFDTLLVMSVEPGFGGQKFMPEVLDKVRTGPRARSTPATCGCSSRSTAASAADTIEQAAEAGVDVFVAGSAVYDAGRPGRRGRRAARAGPGRHDPLRARGRPAVTASRAAQPASRRRARPRCGTPAELARTGGRPDQPEPAGGRGDPGRRGPDRRAGRHPAARRRARRGDGAGRRPASRPAAAPRWSPWSRATTPAGPGRAPRR